MKTFGQVLPSSPKIPGSFFFLHSLLMKERLEKCLAWVAKMPSPSASQHPSLYLTTLLCWTDFLLLKGNGESPSSHAAVSHEMAIVRCD